ncbi:MAG TPA: TonB-dependent receptor [Bryobacteraceae bacterium]|nr:TonB-dependent receptor [Bryobacteraceae bacterium]
MTLARFLSAMALLCQPVLSGAAPPEAGAVEIRARDQAGRPIPGVLVEVSANGQVISRAVTDGHGQATLHELPPGQYAVAVAAQGFEPAQQGIRLAQNQSAAVEITLVPELVRKDSIEVRDTATPVEQGAAVPDQLPPQTARELPSRPATVADALPLVPGVVRSPEGGLRISGGQEHRSTLIVNSADVTDPATGQFGLTVPIDSVETLNVFQTPFLAQYGRFSAGLVSVETRRGGDQWKWELNDPFPDFRIRSYQLRGLRDATPRLNFEGPLIPPKLYFSEGFEYEIRKTEVYTLPFPDNQRKQEGINSFSQFDWVASDRHLVTATMHVAPQRLQYANINYFNPEPTSPDAGTHEYTATVADRLTLGGGLLENTLSATQFDARVWAQGAEDLTLTPVGNTGNYFARQNRNASRLGWSSTYSFAPRNALGVHNVKAGSYLAVSSDRGLVFDRPIDIADPTGQLLERITFSGGSPFRMSDFEYAFFAQDHWILSPRLALDFGLRSESQEVSESLRLAPRAGIAWNPFSRAGTVVRAGFGLFYDRVPLNVYSFDHYPNQTATFFDGAGQITAGPFLYVNGLGLVNTPSPLVFREGVAGNFSPRSETWSVQVEQPLSPFVKLRAGYMQNLSSGLVVLNRVAPDPLTQTGALLLSGTGRARYRQFELTARVRIGESRTLFFSYVRSRARGDLNDFGDFLDSFPTPIVRPNQFGNLPSDLPNRFLAWGVVPLKWGFRIAPVAEYRNGFAYAPTDALQNWVGVPYQSRFPNFLSVDCRFSKDIKVNAKYTVRLSVSSYNLTDHFNPEAVHYNVADPAYGFFFGQRGRRFTADFDVLF